MRLRLKSMCVAMDLIFSQNIDNKMETAQISAWLIWDFYPSNAWTWNIYLLIYVLFCLFHQYLSLLNTDCSLFWLKTTEYFFIIIWLVLFLKLFNRQSNQDKKNNIANLILLTLKCILKLLKSKQHGTTQNWTASTSGTEQKA